MHKYTRQLRENRVFARDGTSGRKYASFRQSAHHADSQRLTPDTPVRSIFPRCRKASSALRKSLFGTLIMPVSHNNKSRFALRNGFPYHKTDFTWTYNARKGSSVWTEACRGTFSGVLSFLFCHFPLSIFFTVRPHIYTVP